MSIGRFFLTSIVALTVMVVSGCALFDSSIPENNNNPIVPPASTDLSVGNYFGGPTDLSSDLSHGGGWVDSSSGMITDDEFSKTSSTSSMFATDWIAYDPGKNLGFPIVYFAYDTDVLTPSETAKLKQVQSYMKAEPSLGLIIEGHCDQRGTEEYNRALGERRANSIRAYLVNLGLSNDRIKTMSYGKDLPAVEGSTEAAWSKNRRGVLVPATMK